MGNRSEAWYARMDQSSRGTRVGERGRERKSEGEREGETEREGERESACLDVARLAIAIEGERLAWSLGLGCACACGCPSSLLNLPRTTPSRNAATWKTHNQNGTLRIV